MWLRLMEYIYTELETGQHVRVLRCKEKDGCVNRCGTLLTLAEKLQLLLSVHITVIKPCWHQLRCSSPPPS